MTRIFALTSAALLLAACDTQGSGTTTTKLDAVEVEPGTASDAMILLDDSNVDGTAVDNSAVLTAEGQAAAKAEAAKAAPVEDADGDATETEDAPEADKAAE